MKYLGTFGEICQMLRNYEIIEVWLSLKRPKITHQAFEDSWRAWKTLWSFCWLSKAKQINSQTFWRNEQYRIKTSKIKILIF